MPSSTTRSGGKAKNAVAGQQRFASEHEHRRAPLLKSKLAGACEDSLWSLRHALESRGFTGTR
jgi:hypothetical protein